MVKKFLTGLSSYDLIQALLQELGKILETGRVCEKEAKEESGVREPTGRSLTDGLSAICSGSFLFEMSALQLAKDALIPAHHPAVFRAAPKLWPRILRNFDLTPKDLFAKYGDEVQKLFSQSYKPSAQYENALATVAALAPDSILPTLVPATIRKLDNAEIRKVTKDEYFTYLTPEGELYDKSMLPSNGEDDIMNTMNMKRESKAYSFKEQQEELQLRRELYEKRKKEGKIQQQKLTPKQEEALKAQTTKESAIRQRLTKLKADLDEAVSIIDALSRGNAFELSLHFKDLVVPILRTLESPLAAPIMAEVFVKLGHIVHVETCTICTSPILNDLVAHVTMRQQRPQCDLDQAWEDEDLDSAVKRTLALLHNRTVTQKQLLRATAVCYVFPFVKKTLLTVKDDNVVVQGLQIVQDHVKQRSADPENPKDDRHPRHLPRKHMFDLLIELMGNVSGRVQSQAVATLLDVAQSGSGVNGAALSSSEEIDSLIGALQNSSSVIRDVALRFVAIKCLGGVGVSA